MKVAINGCFGGFSLSPLALLRMYELGYRGNVIPALKYYGGRGDMLNENLNEFKKWELDKKQRLGMMVPVFVNNYTEILSDAGRDSERNDPLLIQIIEEMGDAANGTRAKLEIIEIPDGVDFTIEEYDGNEHIAEKHRTWR